MKTVALISAGGKGVRMGQNIPKQFLNVNEKPVVIYTLEIFQNHPMIDSIVVVCLEGWENMLKAYAEQFGITKLVCIVPGGENLQESVCNGIFEIEKRFKPEDLLVFHDAVRPLVTAEVINDCIFTAKEKGYAVAVSPCTDGMVKTKDGIISDGYYPRDKIMHSQTPQCFTVKKICDLERRAIKEGITNSMSPCVLMTEFGEEIYLSKGSAKNIKLTTTEDIEIFKALLIAKDYDWIKK